MQTGTASRENSMNTPYKIKNRATTRPCKHTLGTISREKHDLKGHILPNVHCNTVCNTQDMEATWMLIERGRDKEDVVHIYSGILISH